MKAEDLSDFRQEYFKDVLNQIEETEDELFDYLSNHDLNTCDKCDMIDDSTELIWITAEDFEPHPGEIVPASLYKKYDALCEGCYLKNIKVKK